MPLPIVQEKTLLRVRKEIYLNIGFGKKVTDANWAKDSKKNKDCIKRQLRGTS